MGLDLWVVCYDVRDDKRRRRLVKRLEQRCQRVQFSVFECPLTESALKRFINLELLPTLKLDEDNLRAYPLEVHTKLKTLTFGSNDPYEPPDYLIF